MATSRARAGAGTGEPSVAALPASRGCSGRSWAGLPGGSDFTALAQAVFSRCDTFT